MRMVPIGVADRVLHVTDQRVVPVAHIERAVRTELQVDRPEIAVTRTDDRFDFDSYEARSFVFDDVLENSLLADAVVQ